MRGTLFHMLDQRSLAVILAFGSIAVLPFFVVFGAVIGARFGHAEGAVQDEVETGASEAPGILDG